MTIGHNISSSAFLTDVTLIKIWQLNSFNS